jgi:hypothetical protein
MAKDSYQDGMKVRRRVLGDGWVDRSLANRNDFNAEIQRQITSHVWGDIWTRPAIDLKTLVARVVTELISARSRFEFGEVARDANCESESSRAPMTTERRPLAHCRRQAATPGRAEAAGRRLACAASEVTKSWRETCEANL